MTRKTIAVDIDDVLAINVPAFLEFSNRRWGTNLTIDDFREDWGAMWQIEKETWIERMNEIHESKIFSSFKSFEDAKEVLQGLASKYRLIIITSRRKELEQETAAWIDEYFPDVFEEVHHAGIWDKLEKEDSVAIATTTKAEICSQLGGDYLIDDHLKHCFAAADSGIPSLLFGDYPWNRADTLPEGVVRVRDWRSVGDYFNGQS